MAPVKLPCFFCENETYNPDGICARCRKAGKSYPEPDEIPGALL